MTHISVQEFESNSADVLRRLRRGEELLLEEDGIPFGRVSLTPEQGRPRKNHIQLGALAGQGSFPDDWKDIGRDDIEEHLRKL